MPCQIIKGFINYLGGTQQLNASVWDGETPRYDVNGQPVNPETPKVWPVVKLMMPQAGFKRHGNVGTDPYKELGTLYVRVWGTTRDSVEQVGTQVEGFVVPASNWPLISAFLGGPVANPYYVAKLLLDRWSSYQDENVRTDQGELLYIYEIDLDVVIHGATPSQ